MNPFLRWNSTLAVAVFSFLVLSIQAQGQSVYSNSGNNTTGFTTQYDPGGNLTSFVSDGTDIVLTNGGIWDTIPATVSGDFEISYDVKNDSGDGDAHLMILDKGTEGGVGVTNSPQSTDTDAITIVSATDFTNYSQYFFPTTAETLASAPSTSFPNDTWTTVIVTRKGDILTDDVGGQIIEANIGSLNLTGQLQLGLGGYATTNDGGAGKLYYRNIEVTQIPEPGASSLVAVSLLACVGVMSWKRRGSAGHAVASKQA